MTSFDQQPQQDPTAAPAPAPEISLSGGLPPTGVDQQLQTLQAQGQQAAQLGLAPQQQGISGQGGGGNTSLESLVQQMAGTYGLQLPRGNIVDESGNILISPDQLAAASGGTESLGTASWKLQQLSQAVTNRLNEQQQEKARAAVATGIGQVQQRGRGSLASLQMGAYRDLADLYANQEYQAGDFSYWIQKEQQDIAQELERRREKAAKSGNLLGSVFKGFGAGAAFGPIGGLIGAVGGGLLGFGANEGWF